MSVLAARVAAKNRANAYALELYDMLSPIFRPLVGTKIYNKDGTLSKRVQSLLPDIPRHGPLHVYKYPSEYSLMYVVEAFESLPDGSRRYSGEANVYIGNIRDGVLTEITERPVFRTDYSTDEITKLRLDYEAANKIARDLLNKLSPFGEYDR